MSWIVRIRREAERDAARARDWYGERGAGLGERFLDDLSAAMLRLETNPLGHLIYYRKFRRVLLRRFPYKIFYQVIGEEIVVFRILHEKQAHERSLGSSD